MPRPPALPPLLLLLAALATAFAGCGEEEAELLPGGTAREITANLDAVEQLAGEGDCLGAESATLQVSEQVEAIEGVDPRLKRALEQGAARLEEVVARCQEDLEATEPAPTEVEPEEDADERQKEEEEALKEEERREKEEEKEEERREKEDEDEGPPPPQAEGEGKGVEGEGGGPPPGEEGDAPSGGVAPANPAGEG